MISEALSAFDQLLKEQYVDANEFEEFQREQSNNLMKLKNDLQMARIKDYVQARTLHDQASRELVLGRHRCREMLGMMRSEIKLDMSIERGRQKDNLAALSMKIQGLSSKFDHEASSCLSHIQRIRQETVYTISGYIFTAIAALLGYLRLIKKN